MLAEFIAAADKVDGEIRQRYRSAIIHEQCIASFSYYRDVLPAIFYFPQHASPHMHAGLGRIGL